MIRLFLAMTMLASSFAQAGEGTININAVTVPFVKVNNKKISNVDVVVYCEQNASPLQQLNNGLDPWVTCETIELSPKTSTEGWNTRILSLKKNASGTFAIPKLTVNHSKTLLSKNTLVCVELQPKDIEGKSISTSERALYCSQGEAPKWTSPHLRNAELLKLEAYSSTISKGISFTAQ